MQPSSPWSSMVFGVGLIVRDGLESGHLLGDALAAARRLLASPAPSPSAAPRGQDMGFVPLLSAIIPAAVGLYHARPVEGIAIDHPGWILLDGVVLMPARLLVPRDRPALSVGAGSGDVLPAGNDPGADLGLADLCRSPDQQTLVGGADPDPGAGAHSLWQVRVRTRAAAMG